MVGNPPMVVPGFVARSLGCEYVHAHVMVPRLVMEEMEGGVLRVCGSVLSRLCHIPLRTRGVPDSFRAMCRSIRRLVMPVEGCDPSGYAWTQWCIAILPVGSTVLSGPCRLVLPCRGGEIRCRGVDHSLQEEMVRMGCIDKGCAIEVVGLPPHTNDHNRSMVTLQVAAEHLLVSYAGGVLCSVDRVQGQSIDVHRYLSHGSRSMVGIKDGMRRLWYRSFECHGCYSLDGSGHFIE